MKNKNIVVIFVLLLLASIFIMPVSSQSSLPIELKLIAEPSTITLGGTSTVTVKLLDEKGKPVNAEADIHINLSATRGYVNPSMVISAGINFSKTEFTSKDLGIAVISVGSRGLINDTVSIAVVSTAIPNLYEMATEGATVDVNAIASPTVVATAASTTEVVETTTEEPTKEPGFEALFTIAGLLAVTYLLRRRK